MVLLAVLLNLSALLLLQPSAGAVSLQRPKRYLGAAMGLNENCDDAKVK